jgi:flagellar protein FliL
VSATTAPEHSASDAPKKSKKLVLIIALVVLLAAAGGGFVYWKKMKAASEEDADGAAPAHAEHVDPKAPPTFLPLENMVVNLADPAGDRFAQIGITLEVTDSKTAELVKSYMPSIRNGILMLVSQRTSEELLQREGKEKLAEDIRREVARPLGVEPEEEEHESPKPSTSKKKGKKKKSIPNPIQGVLFSSFIVQ